MVNTPNGVITHAFDVIITRYLLGVSGYPLTPHRLSPTPMWPERPSQFNVSFDQPVEVEDETMLDIYIGAYCAEGTPRTATYQSDSGAKALVFAYAVKVCDLGTGGVIVGDGNDD